MESYEFIERFRYQHWLLRHDPEIMSSFEVYRDQVGRLRSESIRELRIAGVPGYVRAKLNNALERFIYVSYTDYLWFRNKRCALCSGVIQELVEVTTDHIVPTAAGGANVMENKQIAHGHCNVLKSHFPIKRLNSYVLSL